jgi:hypothetical protein
MLPIISWPLSRSGLMERTEHFEKLMSPSSGRNAGWVRHKHLTHTTKFFIEDGSPLGFSAVYSRWSRPTFQRWVRSRAFIASTINVVSTSETSFYFNETTRRSIPEGHYLTRSSYDLKSHACCPFQNVRRWTKSRHPVTSVMLLNRTVSQSTSAPWGRRRKALFCLSWVMTTSLTTHLPRAISETSSAVLWPTSNPHASDFSSGLKNPITQGRTIFWTKIPSKVTTLHVTCGLRVYGYANPYSD